MSSKHQAPPRKQMITTIGEVIANQSIVPDWMGELRDKYGENTKVGVECVVAPDGHSWHTISMQPVHEIVIRAVYSDLKQVVHLPEEEGQTLRDLEVIARRIRNRKDGEWYISSIVHCNGDFCSYPHPEELTASVYAEPMFPSTETGKA